MLCRCVRESPRIHERAAELQRRIEALQYRPETGFHRDRLQMKAGRPVLRLVK